MFDLLPEEVWILVLSFLEDKSLVKLSLVSRDLNRLVQEQGIWKARFLSRNGPLKPNLNPEPDYRKVFLSIKYMRCLSCLKQGTKIADSYDCRLWLCQDCYFLPEFRTLNKTEAKRKFFLTDQELAPLEPPRKNPRTLIRYRYMDCLTKALVKFKSRQALSDRKAKRKARASMAREARFLKDQVRETEARAKHEAWESQMRKRFLAHGMDFDRYKDSFYMELFILEGQVIHRKSHLFEPDTLEFLFQDLVKGQNKLG